MMLLRVATYNLHKGMSPLGRKTRIHEMKEALASLDADLIFLQEVQGEHQLRLHQHPNWPEQGQHQFLAGHSHHLAYGMNAVYAHGHHGNALLSKHRIGTYANHNVSDHRFEQRGILHAVVDLPAHFHFLNTASTLHCFVIHLGLFASSRRRQVQNLIQVIKASVPSNAPIVIAGDFNDWNNQLSTYLYESLGVQEAFAESASSLHRKKKVHAKTFPAILPWLRLDRIYCRGLDILEVHQPRGKPWNRLSDHLPLCVDLRFSPHPENG